MKGISRKDKVILPQMEEKSKTNQRIAIVQYLNEHPEGATVRDLVVKLNINSPTKRISELIRSGVSIEKRWAHRMNSKGEKKRFMRYRLGKENE